VASLKNTLNLPETAFPMRANLVQREPARVKYWEDSGLYQKIQEKNRSGTSFVLHDGPPFTNGDLHLGHALNKTLKDTLLRYKWMQGYSAPYVPGWDSHGLPIEHKVSRELQNSGRKEYSALEVRQACARFADKYRKIQTEQFKRLGVLGDWESEYWTLHPGYEATELETFARFVERGLVYRSKKPVYWSIPCMTALAEAEIEYREHRSPSIYVRFPLSEVARQKLGMQRERASVLIWTTTPWTLPANLAVSVHPRVAYTEIIHGEESLLVATDLVERVVAATGLEEVRLGATWKGSELEQVELRHPFIDRPSPILLAEYVTTEDGTGCVHTAPGHGLEDYLTGLQNNLEVYCPLDDTGSYVDDGQIPPELVGVTVLESKGKSPANFAVLQLLEETGTLLKLDFFQHSYPHCWRSKTPVIFRAMDQWFIALDKDGVRSEALKALSEVQFIPSSGENRLRDAVANRPDWCISRQRSWGVPLPVFYHHESGEPFLEAGVIRSLAGKIASRGTDFWFQSEPGELLEGISLPDHWPTPQDLVAGKDTLDVWIDSGCSHRAVLQNRSGLSWPADLYLEGSDQHRGWFQSSLWTGVVADGSAPYRSILTHGFIVNEDRTKLSKSSGQARSLPDWIKLYGADILRLWICSQDYRGDVPVSDNIVKNIANSYRTIRNTFRFQIGNLFDFSWDKDAVPLEEMHFVDRWVLHELGELIQAVTAAFDSYEFHRAFRKHLEPFLTHTLSATYHDILKDRLYTLAPNDKLRRSSQTALYLVFSSLTRLIAPLLPFTADEAWSFAQNGQEYNEDSVALQEWPIAQEKWRHPEIAGEFKQLRDFLAEHLNDRLENLRKNKVIGQSLDAKAILRGSLRDPLFALLKKYESDLPEIFILSQVILEIDEGLKSVQVETAHADGLRCPRTWRWVSKLVATEEWGEVSERCARILSSESTLKS